MTDDELALKEADAKFPIGRQVYLNIGNRAFVQREVRTKPWVQGDGKIVVGLVGHSLPVWVYNLEVI